MADQQGTWVNLTGDLAEFVPVGEKCSASVKAERDMDSQCTHCGEPEPWVGLCDRMGNLCGKAAAREHAPGAGSVDEPLRHATKENGDCPHWCKACAAEKAARGVNSCETPSITDDEAVTLAIGVGGALFSGNAGNERTYIMSRSDIGRFARAVQKGSTAGVDVGQGGRDGL